MRPPHRPEAWRAIELFDDAPPGDRLHVRIRWVTCPFAEVERAVPLAGRVLEVGCGHGLLSLYLALCAPTRDVLGVDIDAHKIELARAAATELEPGEATVHFDRLEVGTFAEGTFDAIVICDVLYLLPAPARAALLEECVRHLAPEGVLVVKEADRVPRWKGALTVAQELVSTRVLRITEGDEVAFAPPTEFVDQLVRAGLDAALVRVDRGYLYPHVLVTGRLRSRP